MEGGALVLNNPPDTPRLVTLTEPTTGDPGRKRPIEAVEDVEEQDSSLRRRRQITEHGPDVADRALGEAYKDKDTDVEPSQKTSDLESTSTALETRLRNTNSIDNDRAASTSAHENDAERQNTLIHPNGGDSTPVASDGMVPSGGEVQENAALRSVRPVDWVSAPRAIPRSWDQAHEADLTLFRMRKGMRDWLEICYTWKQITGQDVRPATLASRYERLKTETQDSLDHNDTLLLAAVEEITAEFQRQKWQLVSEAMERRTATGYPKDLCRQKYETLLRIAPNATARITEDSLQGQGIYAMGQSSGKELADRYEKAIESYESMGGTSATLSAWGLAASNEALKTQHSGNHTSSNTDAVKPGSLLTNAIVVEDSDANSSTPLSRTASATTTASRVGSATNRGPARFTSVPRSTTDNAVGKSAKTSNPTNTALSFQGFGILKKSGPQISNESLHYNARQAPTPLVDRMAKQQVGAHPPSQQQGHPPQPPSIPPPSYQYPFPQPPIPYGLPFQQAPAYNTVGYQTPSAPQSTLPAQPTQQELPVQSNEGHPQDKLNTPLPTNASLTVKKHPGGRPKKPVTKDLLSRMIKHKNTNEANQSKPWDVIARELGATATPKEISDALNEAGISHSSNDVSENGFTDMGLHSSPDAAILSAETATVTNPGDVAPAAATSATSARAPETPAPAGTDQNENTPSTRRTRRRPPKHLSETPSAAVRSPSQTQNSSKKTPNSKQSEAMKAAWARRKAREATGWNVGPQKPSTITRDSLNGDSAAAFAAQVLAAAAAHTNATPTPAPQAGQAGTVAAGREPQDDEPRDLLTGETMYAQHQDEEPPASPHGSPKPKKKIVRRSHTFVRE